MQINSLFTNQLGSKATPIHSSAQNLSGEHIQNSKSFGNYLKRAIQEVNEMQVQSDEATAMFAEGKKIDLHEVMIDGQKASISMQAALEIRNKAVEAYQEIMRMQV